MKFFILPIFTLAISAVYGGLVSEYVPPIQRIFFSSGRPSYFGSGSIQGGTYPSYGGGYTGGFGQQTQLGGYPGGFGQQIQLGGYPGGFGGGFNSGGSFNGGFNLGLNNGYLPPAFSGLGTNYGSNGGYVYGRKRL